LRADAPLSAVCYLCRKRPPSCCDFSIFVLCFLIVTSSLHVYYKPCQCSACVQNARGATLIQFNTYTLRFALINANFLDWTERAARTACKFCVDLIGTGVVSMNLLFAPSHVLYREIKILPLKYKQ
jgi:hypothetical protein